MYSQRSVVVVLVTLIIFIELKTCTIVTTPDGSIEGGTMLSRRGISFDAFLQIPFAKPPIAELRFKDPLPNDPWSDTLDGTVYGPACPQQAGLIPAANISENCLHLNVFTKSLPGSGSDPRPVIVYIHGGGFLFGSAIISSPTVMMDRDIVFVTINYRMGAFGFLATGSQEAPGNAGMKDQVMALKWIKRNIAAFGGDDENITIWGMSAGSFCVTAHLASPLSRGLFNRVIAMSGSISSHKDLSNNLMGIVTTTATGVNCERDDPDELVQCLRNRTLEEIVAVPIAAPEESCPMLPWWPVIEPDFGQEKFLDDQPTKLFESGEFIRVPTMIGITADEYASLVPGVLRNSSLMNDLNANFADLAPKCFLYEQETEKSSAMSKSFRENYFPYEMIDSRSFEDLNHLFSDSIMGYPTHLFVNSASKFIDVYYYRFSYIGSFSLFNHPRNEPYSVAHGDDIHYLVPWTFLPAIDVNDPDNFIVERLLSIYENFARNGNPNNSSDVHLSTMNWPEFDEEDAYYLDMGRHFVEKHGLYLNRFARWSNLEQIEPNSAAELSSTLIGLVAFFALLFC